MKTLYLECTMGAAGDMLTAALLEIVPDRAAALARINALGIPGVHVHADPAVQCGLTGTRVDVHVHGHVEEEHHHHHHDHAHHHHHHASRADVAAQIAALNASDAVKAHVQAVYDLIADAESKAHGRPVSEIHFHEVGMADALSDIASVALLLEMLGPDRVVASRPEVGGGFVQCAHGTLHGRAVHLRRGRLRAAHAHGRGAARPFRGRLRPDAAARGRAHGARPRPP